MATKKDYELVAAAIKRVGVQVGIDGWPALERVTRELGFVFEVDNPNFDFEKFYEAAGF